jgi:drug/metabolite transporter (DMT)-like permease
VDLDISLDYGLTLLAALLIGTGFVFQQNAAAREPESRFLSLRLIVDLLRTPRWLAGIVCMIGGQILSAWSIGHLELSFVEPLLTTNLIFALVLSVPLSGASIRFWEVVGATVLCAGVGLLSATRSAKPIGLSIGSFSHWPAAAVIAFVAFIAVQAGRRRPPGRTRAMLTGVGAGLVFGIQDALTRQTLEILQSSGISALFTVWAPYALVGAGATGIWLMQSAFSTGSLQVSLPAISAGEPLVGILLGVVVFGDRIQISPGMLAIQASGIAALVVGVILVGRAPALTALRGIPHTLPHSGRHPASDAPGRDSGEDSARSQPEENRPAASERHQDSSPNGSRPVNKRPGERPPWSQRDMRRLTRRGRRPRFVHFAARSRRGGRSDPARRRNPASCHATTTMTRIRNGSNDQLSRMWCIAVPNRTNHTKLAH